MRKLFREETNRGLLSKRNVNIFNCKRECSEHLQLIPQTWVFSSAFRTFPHRPLGFPPDSASQVLISAPSTGTHKKEPNCAVMRTESTHNYAQLILIPPHTGNLVLLMAVNWRAGAGARREVGTRFFRGLECGNQSAPGTVGCRRDGRAG